MPSYPDTCDQCHNSIQTKPYAPSPTISVLLHTRIELCLSLGNGHLLYFLGQRVPPLAPVATVDHVQELPIYVVRPHYLGTVLGWCSYQQSLLLSIPWMLSLRAGMVLRDIVRVERKRKRQASTLGE